MDIAAVLPVALASPPAPTAPGEPAEGFGAMLGDVLEGMGLGLEFGVEGDAEDAAPDSVASAEVCPCPFAPELVRALLPWGGGADGAVPGGTEPEGGGDEPAANAAVPAAMGEVARSANTGGEIVSLPGHGAVPAGPKGSGETVPPEWESARARTRSASFPEGEREYGTQASPTRERAWAAPGARARAERLWGFWLRQGTASSGAPGEVEAAGVTRGGGPTGFGPIGQELTGNSSGEVPESVSLETPDALSGTQRGPARASAVPERPAPDVAAVTARQGGEPVQELPVREPVPPAPPARQVAHAVHVAVSRGGDRVSVRLEPEHLGRVEVVLGREAGGVTAHLRVESAQAHQALTAEIPLLREALEARGVSLVHVQVDLDDGSQGGQRPGSEAGGRRRRGGPGGGQAEPSQAASAGGGPWRPWGFEALI